MITDCYDASTQSVMSLRDFYGEPGHFVDVCLIVFSGEIYRHLIDSFPCKKIGELGSCNGKRSIYKTVYHGREFAFYLSMIGSALAVAQCEEAAWITGARKFVLFGSCGSLDRGVTDGHFIVPTESYRGEGASYYYAPPTDYIGIKNCDRVAKIFESAGIPYVCGRIWTTDCMGRETRGLVAARRGEGCIAVEMEIAGVQASCDFNRYELYCFLEAGDVLSDEKYDVEGLKEANHGLAKLYVALRIVLEI